MNPPFPSDTVHLVEIRKRTLGTNERWKRTGRVEPESQRPAGAQQSTRKAVSPQRG